MKTLNYIYSSFLGKLRCWGTSFSFAWVSGVQVDVNSWKRIPGMPILPLQLDHIWWSRFMLHLTLSINLRNNFTSTGQVMSVAFSNVEYSKLVQKWLSTYMYKTLLDPSLILRSLQFNQGNYLQNFYQENVSRLQRWWSKLENVTSQFYGRYQDFTGGTSVVTL